MESIRPRSVLIGVTAVNDLASSHIRIYYYPFTVSTSYRLTTKLYGRYQYATCKIPEIANSKLLVGWSLPCVSRVLHGMTFMSGFDNHVLVFSDLSSSLAPYIYIRILMSSLRMLLICFTRLLLCDLKHRPFLRA